MGRFGRSIGVCLVVASAAAGGCAFGKKPYTDDPLLANRRGVWGDRDKARKSEFMPAPEPAAPQPPVAPGGGPLIAAAEPVAVTSPR